MGTLRSIKGLEYRSNMNLEQAKASMLAYLDKCYPISQQAESYFFGPFTVEEDRYKCNSSKCAKNETVLVFRDATGVEYRRFIFKP
jgi:hypothetical protein